jgi:hypothetical protein
LADNTLNSSLKESDYIFLVYHISIPTKRSFEQFFHSN